MRRAIIVAGLTRGRFDVYTADRRVFVVDLDRGTLRCESDPDNHPKTILRANGVWEGSTHGVFAVDDRTGGIAGRLIPTGHITAITRSQQTA
jgi:hypothetical protein